MEGMENAAKKPFSLEAAVVRGTEHGKRAVEALHSYLGAGAKSVLPCQMTGSMRKMSNTEVGNKYPHYDLFKRAMGGVANHLMEHGYGTSPTSYVYRSAYLDDIELLASITAKLQFASFYDENMVEYAKENKGWGTLIYDNNNSRCVRLEAVDENGLLREPVVLDLYKKAYRIDAVDWEGNIHKDLLLCDINQDQEQEVPEGASADMLKRIQSYNENLPIYPAIRYTADSLTDELVEEASDRYGRLSKGDPVKILTHSPLRYQAIRIQGDDQEAVSEELMGFETNIYIEMDFCSDIDIEEYAAVSQTYLDLEKAGQYDNSRAIAINNLMYWGILNKENFKHGKEILDRVLSAKKVVDHHTVVDDDLMAWMTYHDTKRQGANGFVAKAYGEAKDIPQRLNTETTGVYRFLALVLEGWNEDGTPSFTEMWVASPTRDPMMQVGLVVRTTVRMLNLVQVDGDYNPIKLINPMNVFLVASYQTTSVISIMDGEVVSPENKAIYDKVRNFLVENKAI